MSGGLVLVGRDGACCDLASVHGSHRRVAETRAAVEAVAEHLARVEVRDVLRYLDRPVSNSGRLSALIREVGAAHGRVAGRASCSRPRPCASVSEPARVGSLGRRVGARSRSCVGRPRGRDIRERVPRRGLLALGA